MTSDRFARVDIGAWVFDLGQVAEANRSTFDEHARLVSLNLVFLNAAPNRLS